MKDSKPNNLFNKNFFLLLQGQFVSKLGSQIFLVAMVLWIKDATESASLLGLLGFVIGIPAVIFSAIGGTFADRHSRKKIIVFSDFISGILTAFLAGALFYFPDSNTIILSAIFVVAISSSIVESFFNPAISAAIPDIVPTNKLTSVNGWIQGSQQFSSIVGWAIGGTLYILLGAPLLVLINSVSFLFSAASEFFIEIPQIIPEKKKVWKEKYHEFKLDLFDGFKYIWAKSGLKKMVLASVFLNFVAAPILLLLPFYIDIYLKVEDDWFGYLVAISSIGAVLGYILAGTIKVGKNKQAIIILLFIFLDGVTYILLGVMHSLIPVIAVFFITGFLDGYIQVQIFTILQITTEANKRGRVFGFLGTISAALAPIGMGLAGLIADLTNKNIPIIYISCGVIIIILIMFLAPSKDIRLFLSQTVNNLDEENSDQNELETKNKTENFDESDVVLNKIAMKSIEKSFKKIKNKK